MELIVGIDVGASFHVAAMAFKEAVLQDWKRIPTTRIDCNAHGYEALREAVGHYSRGAGEARASADGQNLGHHIIAAMEPTGRFYSETIRHYCEAQGWTVRWVENKALHEYRAMMKSPSKTDDWDARLLAHYIASGHQSGTRPDDASRALRQLTQELQGLRVQRLAARNRLCQCLKVTFPELKIGDGRRMIEALEFCNTAEAFVLWDPDRLAKMLGNAPLAARIQALARESVGFPDPLAQSRIETAVRAIRCCDARRAEILKEMEQRVQEHPDGALVMSLPAVATTTAAALIGTYGTVQRYKTKAEFRHRLGVAAVDRQSGTSVSSRKMNRRATKHARTALHMATIGLLAETNRPNAFADWFDAHRNDEARGHNKRKLGRLRGKLADVLFAILKSRTPYQAEAHREEIRRAHPQAAGLPEVRRL